MLLSLHPSFAFPPHVLKSIFYVYLFNPELGSSVPFFFLRYHIYALAYGICFSLSDLLCMTDARSIHLTANNSISFLFMAEQYSIVCMCHIFFIHSSVDGHLGWFHPGYCKQCCNEQPLWRTVWRFLTKLKIELPYDPAIPLLGIYPEKTIIQKETFTTKFIAALFTGVLFLKPRRNVGHFGRSQFFTTINAGLNITTVTLSVAI